MEEKVSEAKKWPQNFLKRTTRRVSNKFSDDRAGKEMKASIGPFG